MEALVIAVPFAFFAAVICWIAVRAVSAERNRRRSILLRIAALRSRARGVRDRLAKALARKIPASLRHACVIGEGDVDRTVRGAEKAVADAEACRDIRPESSLILLDQASGLLDAAESMLEMSDVTIPAMVAEQRRYARQMLEQNRSYRAELQQFIAASSRHGIRFDEEARRVAMAENAIKAEESAMADDPLASMRRMRTLSSRLSGIAAYVYFHRAVFDHVMDSAARLADRLRDAEILDRSADAMAAELRARGFAADEGRLSHRGGSVAELCGNVRTAIDEARAFCTGPERRLGSAIVRIAYAESDVAEIERRLLVVMQEWSLRVGRFARH